jgi:hypothetical protein
MINNETIIPTIKKLIWLFAIIGRSKYARVNIINILLNAGTLYLLLINGKSIILQSGDASSPISLPNPTERIVLITDASKTPAK